MLDFGCDDALYIWKTELAQLLRRRYPYRGDAEAAQGQPRQSAVQHGYDGENRNAGA